MSPLSIRTHAIRSLLTRAAAAAQEVSRPFAIGEALTYQVRVSRVDDVGDVGEGQMWIEGPVVEAGIPTWRLRFEIRAGKGPIRATDGTSSWIDPVTFGIVRVETDDIDGGGGALGHVKPLEGLGVASVALVVARVAADARGRPRDGGDGVGGLQMRIDQSPCHRRVIAGSSRKRSSPASMMSPSGAAAAHATKRRTPRGARARCEPAP